MHVKGVNLGNWLVLEKWMSPSLFEGTTAEDEYYLPTQLSTQSSVHHPLLKEWDLDAPELPCLDVFRMQLLMANGIMDMVLLVWEMQHLPSV